MMRAPFALTTVALAALASAGTGCGVKLVDPCSGVTGTCLTVQVDRSPAVGAIDRVGVHLAGAGLDVSRSVDNGKRLTLPVAVAVIFDTLPASPLSFDLTVTGDRDGAPFGAGSARVTLSDGEHQTVHVRLEAVGAPGDGGAPPDFANCTPTVTSCPASVVCGRVSDGCGGSVDCGRPCQLLSIQPPLANSGQTIALEGTFTADTTVHFPGGASATAKVLGPHHATVTVPADATAGDLTVESGLTTVGPLRFRRASFTLGVGPFLRANGLAGNYEQTDVARPLSPLPKVLQFPGVVTLGHYLYLIGGYRGGPLTDVVRATINADGTLGPATLLPAGLNVARQGPSVVVLGDKLYVIGGSASGGSVERATIAADGTLSPFTTVSGVALDGDRAGSALVIGTWIYFLGGASDGSIERASIAADGTLSNFAVVPGVTLKGRRDDFSAAIIGSSLFLVGGTMGASFSGSVERASIAGDGTLSDFGLVAAQLTTPRSLHGMLVLGNGLYVFGGTGGNSVELAGIDPVNETIGNFMPVPGVTLDLSRPAAATVVIGDHVYLLGGGNDMGSITAAVTRASINGSGSLGSFAKVAGSALAGARQGHVSVAIGDSLYVIGGAATVERAEVRPDGSLSAFAVVPNVSLKVARSDACVLVANDTVFMIGGSAAGTPVTSVETAPIDANGALGDFTVDSFVNLKVARAGHTCAALGDSIYAFGGSNSDKTVERAIIASAGLGVFALVNGVALSETRVGHSMAVLGGNIYLIGGTLSNNVERAALDVNGAPGTFAPVSGLTLEASRTGHSTLLAGNKLYLVGGGQRPDSVERTSIDAAGAITGGNFGIVNGVLLDTARTNHTTTVLGNAVYAIGGFNGQPLSVVDQALLP